MKNTVGLELEFPTNFFSSFYLFCYCFSFWNTLFPFLHLLHSSLKMICIEQVPETLSATTNDMIVMLGSKIETGEGHYNSIPFPFRLYYLLSKGDYSNVIEWLEDGRGIRVRDTEAFTKEALPRYFKRK